MTTLVAHVPYVVGIPLTEYAAVFSPSRIYRYTLCREVNPDGTGTCAWIMLNPSTADEHVLDPTLTRCFNYTRLWGYRYMLIGNIFAYRATDPKDMQAQTDPIGILNDQYLDKIVLQSDKVICGWGTTQHKYFSERGHDVLNVVRMSTDPYALKITKDGHPSHPLYLKKDLEPVLYL